VKKILIISILLSVVFLASAQKENKLLREGNRLYEKGDFKGAEMDYRKALEVNKESIKGQFNLGASTYQQQNYEESARIFGTLADKNQDRSAQAMIYHNQGNSYLQAKEYEKSILSYKNALMNNPKDVDTKYNLEYAKMMLKKQQQQQQQQKKDQQKKDDKKDKQDQKQQNQDQNKNQKPDQKKISKEDADRMLEALKNDEKKTMQKVKKEKAKVQVVGVEKDW
jgi:Ca-activated chloride channel family protein